MANLVSMLTAVEEKRHKAKADREQEEKAWDAAQVGSVSRVCVVSWKHELWLF